MSQAIAILGAGGHARVIADTLQLSHAAGTGLPLAGFISPEDPGNLPAPWLGADSSLQGLAQAGKFSHVIIGIGSVSGGQGVRQKLQALAETAGCQFANAIHPSAIVSLGAELGTGIAVMAGVVINTGCRVGDHAIINTRSIVDHDCLIGAHSHIAPGAVLSGNVTTGNHSMIGVGAVCRQGVSIGAGSTLGAGAISVHDTEADKIYVGCPARPL